MLVRLIKNKFRFGLSDLWNTPISLIWLSFAAIFKVLSTKPSKFMGDVCYGVDLIDQTDKGDISMSQLLIDQGLAVERKLDILVSEKCPKNSVHCLFITLWLVTYVAEFSLHFISDLIEWRKDGHIWSYCDEESEICALTSWNCWSHALMATVVHVMCFCCSG